MSLVGQKLGEYEIIEEIGRGGMADVYRAYQPSLNRYVAIKVLPPEYARDRAFVERFLREASTAARLEHPNIVPIYEAGEQTGVYYTVMRHLEVKTLKELIEREGALPLPRVRTIAAQLAEALDYAHSQGVIHRDIKPSNIFIGKNDHVTLADFGIARAAEATRLTRSGTLLGTPEYMSPEQAKGGEIDWRTDIYSLGIVAYQMLTGRLPFEASTPHGVLHAQIYEPPPSPRTMNPSMPLSVDKVVRRALTKNINERYQSAGELAQALGGATGTSARRLTIPRRQGSHPLPRAVAMPVALALLVAVAVIAGAGVVSVRGCGRASDMSTVTATSLQEFASMSTAKDAPPDGSTRTSTHATSPRPICTAAKTATTTPTPTATSTRTPTPAPKPRSTATSTLPPEMPSAGATLYVVNRSGNLVSILQAADAAIVDDIRVGNWPQGISATPDGARIYVCNTGSHSVSVVDVASSSVIDTIPVGDDPVTAASSPDGHRLYVVNHMSSSASVVDTSSNSVIATISDVRYPWGVAASPDGTRIAITEYGQGYLSIYDSSSLSVVARVQVGRNPEGVIYHPDGSRIYVANLMSNSVSVIDTGTNTVIADIPVGRGPVQFTFNADASRLYVANNYSANATEINVDATRAIRFLPADAGPIDVEIVGSYLYISNHDADTISVVDLNSGAKVQTLSGFGSPHSMVSLCQQ
jgi:YVTN family beta-propeller protein